MRSSCLHRKAGILTQYEVQHGTTWKKTELHIKQYATKGRMHILSLQKTVTAAGKKMGKALSAAFKLAGFLGIVALLFDMGKAIYEYFNPIPEEAKKAQAAIEDFNRSYEMKNPMCGDEVKVRIKLLNNQIENINKSYI